MSRNLDMATPFMKEFSLQLIYRSEKELGHLVIVTSVDRLFQEQMALFAQSRQPLAEVNLFRKAVGWVPITEEENEKTVTWTMASKHIINLLDLDPANDKSRAVDYGIVIAGKYITEDKDLDANGIPEYDELGLLGEKIGGKRIKWGGRFKDRKGNPKPDPCHFEEVT